MSNADTLIDVEAGDDSPSHSGQAQAQKYPKSDKKIQELKNHVNEVTNVMTENINKILDRGTRLEHLEDRSDMLSSRADEFRVHSRRVARKMWWQNMRVNIIIGLVAAAVVVIIIVTVTGK
ncbi:Synaptobrevin [Halotydeus destructor]|nr:Synaptobrevin [Halotydeus destructor]